MEVLAAGDGELSGDGDGLSPDGEGLPAGDGEGLPAKAHVRLQQNSRLFDLKDCQRLRLQRTRLA